MWSLFFKNKINASKIKYNWLNLIKFERMHECQCTKIAFQSSFKLLIIKNKIYIRLAKKLNCFWEIFFPKNSQYFLKRK